MRHVSDENVELVREAVAAFLGGDLERAFELAHPNAVTFRAPPLPDPQTYHGHEGVLEAYADWTADFEGFEMTTGEFIGAGNRVIVEVFQRAKGLRSGAVVEGRFWFAYAVEDRRIMRQDIFATRQQALDAKGLDDRA
jgi:ketosteroid isomerase-like protein